jgi:hypothetical protein
VLIDASLILWGLLFGCVGFGYYLYGKKQANTVVKYTGITLMISPYFITDAIMLIVVGVVLILLPRFIK